MGFSIISLWKLIILGRANFDPGGLIDRIYVGNCLTLLHVHNLHISCGPHGFRKKIFKGFFFLYKSMETLDPLGEACLEPWVLMSGFM